MYTPISKTRFSCGMRVKTETRSQAPSVIGKLQSCQRMVREMLLELSKYAEPPALYLHPRLLVQLAGLKSSGSQSDRIPYDIPVVRLYAFTHPNTIPGKDCPFAIDGERYYFTKQVHRDASGKRSKRKAGKEGAYWKSTSPDIDIKDLNEELIGYMRKHTLYDDNKRSTNWLMEEYRVHNHHELDDPYILCKIYDKDSICPKHTETSIPALTNRAIKRKRGSQPDQTNSIFNNMSPSSSNPENPLQTQFDNNDFVEDPIMQQTLPTFENFPPNSLPSPRSHVASGNQSNLSQTQFENNNFGVQQTLPASESFPHDASGNQNRPKSVPPSPRNSILMNQSQTQLDNNYFDGDLFMQQTLPTSENFPFDSSLYSNEFLHMIDASSSGPSMPHCSFENLSAPDGEESSPKRRKSINPSESHHKLSIPVLRLHKELGQGFEAY